MGEFSKSFEEIVLGFPFFPSLLEELARSQESRFVFSTLCPADQAGPDATGDETSTQSCKSFHQLLLGRNKLKQPDLASHPSVSGQVCLLLFVYFQNFKYSALFLLQ